MLDFLVTMTTQVPADKAAADVAEMRAREGARAVELAEQGTLLRLWRPPLQPGEWRTLGLFTAPDENSLETDLASMPLRAWRTDEVPPWRRTLTTRTEPRACTPSSTSSR